MSAAGGWLLAAAVLAAFAAGIAWARRRQRRERSVEEAAQIAAIRDLRKLARKVPTRTLFRDPETGNWLGVDRQLNRALQG